MTEKPVPSDITAQEARLLLRKMVGALTGIDPAMHETKTLKDPLDGSLFKDFVEDLEEE